MSDPGKAVFLSYASQDAEVAHRICDTLRAAGIEVWFDQSQLVGGDAWDAKIRGQLKECALFVPIISANTQARREGYFRLEWKLATQRTHTMADGTPFVLPMVVDATRDADALVPEEFRAVQWTRLPLRQAQGLRPDDAVLAAFCARVKHLLGGSAAGPFDELRAGPVVDRAPGQRPGLQPKRRGARPWIAPVLVVLAAIAVAIWQPWRNPAPPPANNARLETPNSKPLDLAAAKSIAVLPFENQSDDKENTAFFAAGMHEDILTSLANIRDLRVISRTSVMEYRGTKKKIPEIARELGVAYILEGSVRRAGNRVRITGQLIRAANDEHLWAKNYDRDLTAKDIFDIQTALAAEIAGALRAIISPEARKLLERRPTENLAAYELYLKAQALVSEFGASRESYERRLRFLQEAVDLDPKFAEAWGALATTHGFFVFSDYDHSAARIQAAEAAMAHALRLAPELPDIIRSLGLYYYGLHRDYERATAQYEKVLQLQPNNAAAINTLGLAQRRQGHWVKSLANLRKASELEPRNVQYSRNVCGILEAGRNWEAVRTELRRIISLHPDNLALQFRLAVMAFSATGSTREVDDWLARLTPAQRETTDGVAARSWRGRVAGALAQETQTDSRAPEDQRESILEDALMMAARGDKAGARSRVADVPAELRARLEREPTNPLLWRRLGIAEALLGRRDEALVAARKAVALRPSALDAYVGPDFQISLAAVHAWTGDIDEALAELTRLLRVPVSGYVGFGVHALRVHPHFAPLRGDPRFEALLNDPKNNAPLF